MNFTEGLEEVPGSEEEELLPQRGQLGQRQHGGRHPRDMSVDSLFGDEHDSPREEEEEERGRGRRQQHWGDSEEEDDKEDSGFVSEEESQEAQEAFAML